MIVYTLFLIFVKTSFHPHGHHQVLIHNDNKNRGFARLSITKKSID
jgi:hypothetical protein